MTKNKTTPDDGLLKALTAMATGLANLVIFNEQLIAAVRGGPRLTEAELEHIERQLKAAKERLPKMLAYIGALSKDVTVH